jgi:NADH-quinone oxidoreductase E subunit
MTIIDEILAKYSDRYDLIEVLEEVQEAFGYVSQENMRKIQQKLNVPLADIYGIVTFYSAFKLTPPGKHVIRVCTGTACHVKGARALQEHLENLLKIKKGGMTADGRFTLDFVNCIGACAKAPNMMVDDKVFGNLTKEKIDKILEDFK